jgi:hypothetical protein
MGLNYLENITRRFGTNERQSTLFTIEMDFDETSIIILDPTAVHEDLQVWIYDEIVYIRQWDDNLDDYNIMAISPEMMLALQKSLSLPAGAYILQKEENK